MALRLSLPPCGSCRSCLPTLVWMSRSTFTLQMQRGAASHKHALGFELFRSRVPVWVLSRSSAPLHGPRSESSGPRAPGHKLLLCGRRKSFLFCPSYSSEDLRVTCTECARHCDCPKPASANLQAAGFHLDRFSQFLLVPVELEMFLC